jgi:hypothetical protein
MPQLSSKTRGAYLLRSHDKVCNTEKVENSRLVWKLRSVIASCAITSVHRFFYVPTTNRLAITLISFRIGAIYGKNISGN